MAHDTALLGKGLEDALADPPHGVGDELEATGLVELLGGLDQAQVALIDEVGEAQLTRRDVSAVMDGKQLVFNEPILEKIVERFKAAVSGQLVKQEALVNFEIDEYDERFLRHLALGYTKEQITNLRGMPFGVKSLEKRQNELIQKLFPEGSTGINATRLVVRALELRILDIDNLEADDE